VEGENIIPKGKQDDTEGEGMVWSGERRCLHYSLLLYPSAHERPQPVPTPNN
jgi:hypothetical protein